MVNNGDLEDLTQEAIEEEIEVLQKAKEAVEATDAETLAEPIVQPEETEATKRLKEAEV